MSLSLFVAFWGVFLAGILIGWALCAMFSTGAEIEHRRREDERL